MSFSKQKKLLFQQDRYNPPPGYYDLALEKVKPSYNTHSFPKGQRFTVKQTFVTPGPGAFHNDAKQKVKKRILEQSKQAQKRFEATQNSNIKISSIPSIPKKSATRVYQELAPGILILHDGIGPGSYNTNIQVIKKKQVTHKINPEHKKKFIDPVQETQIGPSKDKQLEQQLRQDRRLMYQRGIVKSSTIQRNMISPSDLCLQVIILRERMLRGQEVPPPGYYYNPNTNSSFKCINQDRPQELQLLGGKQQRFKQNVIHSSQTVGPGSYQQIITGESKVGGFIPKQQRIINDSKTQHKPGPGAYKIVGVQSVKIEPKGNYPPIFGSGAKRFTSAPKSLSVQIDDIKTEGPGPGSYKIDTKKKKKLNYIKIKRDHFNNTTNNKIQRTNEILISQNKTEVNYALSQKNKNTSSFCSKVQRFGKDQMNMSQGTDQIYNLDNSSILKSSFNRQKGYTGGRNTRFDHTQIRPMVGPGSYDLNLDATRESKARNIVMI